MSNGTIFFWFDELIKWELEAKLWEYNIPKWAKVEFKIHNKNTTHSLCLGSWYAESINSNK